jgi:hypothetical protein
LPAISPHGNLPSAGTHPCLAQLAAAAAAPVAPTPSSCNSSSTNPATAIGNCHTVCINGACSVRPHPAPVSEMPNLVDISARMVRTIAPPVALWRVSAGWGTVQHMTVLCVGGCSCAGWGAMVRRLRHRSIPSESGATCALAEFYESRPVHPTVAAGACMKVRAVSAKEGVTGFTCTLVWKCSTGACTGLYL